MKKILVKNAKVVFPGHELNGETTNIEIVEGVITAIGNISPSDHHVVEHDGLMVSPGWVDMLANLRDPGSEHKETIQSGLDAAARGGFTKVLVSPDTQPPIASKAQVEYILGKAQGHVVEALPAAALSADMAGSDLAELFDMHQAGAVAFTDVTHPVSSGLLNRALQYTQDMGGRILSYPVDPDMGSNGQVNEGRASVLTGMKAIPSIAEESGIDRELNLLAYNGGNLHFHLISSAGSVERIRKAKAQGLNITCSVSWMHLCFDEETVLDFDQQYKVYPPLRSSADREALIAGVADGTIDVICTNHLPEDIENKDVEFEQAAFGVRGLEGFYGALKTYTNGAISDDRLIDAISLAPRRILRLESPKILENSPADLTMFCADDRWTFTKDHVRFGYANTPLIGKELTGKVIGVITDVGGYLND